MIRIHSRYMQDTLGYVSDKKPTQTRKETHPVPYEYIVFEDKMFARQGGDGFSLHRHLSVT